MEITLKVISKSLFQDFLKFSPIEPTPYTHILAVLPSILPCGY